MRISIKRRRILWAFIIVFLFSLTAISLSLNNIPRSLSFRSLRRAYFELSVFDDEIVESQDILELGISLPLKHSTKSSPLIIVLAVHLYQSSRAKWALSSWAVPRLLTMRRGGDIVGYLRIETLYFDESQEFNRFRRFKSFSSRNLSLKSESSAAVRTGQMLRHALDKYPEALWIVKADDDCIIHVGRLIRTLLARNSSTPIIVGHKAPLMWGNYRFVSGGAGFALSSAAVKAIVPKLPECTELGIDAEDVMVSKCLKDILGFGESVISDDEGFNWGTPEQMLKSDTYSITHAFVPPITHHYISPEHSDFLYNPTFSNTLTHVWPFTDLPTGFSISGKSLLSARQVSPTNCTGKPSDAQLAAIESCRTAARTIGYEYLLVQSVDPEGCGDLVTTLRVLYEKGGVVLPLNSDCSDPLIISSLLSSAKEKGETVPKTTLDNPSIWALGSPNHGLALMYDDTITSLQPSLWASSQYNHDIVRLIAALSLGTPSIRDTDGNKDSLVSLTRKLHVSFGLIPSVFQSRVTGCVDFSEMGTTMSQTSVSSVTAHFDSNRFVTVWLRGGLGNQLFMVSAALVYSKAYGRCLILPDEDLNPHRRYSRPYSETVLSAFWTDSSKLSSLSQSTDFKVESVSESNAYGFDNLRDSSEHLVRLEGYFQNYQYHIGQRDQLRDLLSPPTSIVEDITLKYPDLLHSGIAIHVRRGDFLKWSDLYPIPSIQYYSRGVDHFSYLWKSESTVHGASSVSFRPTFFIFSNDFEWVRAQPFFTTIPGNVIFVTDEDEVMSFYMMMLSRFGIVCANSSYCWWAAFLMTSEKKVIFPDKWYERRDTNTTGIYFPGVIMLPSA
jgi:hypothetical protein